MYLAMFTQTPQGIMPSDLQRFPPKEVCEMQSTFLHGQMTVLNRRQGCMCVGSSRWWDIQELRIATLNDIKAWGKLDDAWCRYRKRVVIGLYAGDVRNIEKATADHDRWIAVELMLLREMIGDEDYYAARMPGLY